MTPRAAGRGRPGDHRCEPPAVADRRQRGGARLRVAARDQRRVDPAADQRPRLGGAGGSPVDDLCGAEPQDLVGVGGRGDGDDLDPAVGGELHGDPADRARGADHPERPAALDLQRVQRLQRGHGGGRQGRPLHRGGGAGARGDAVGVDHGQLRRQPHPGLELVGVGDDGLAGRELLHAGPDLGHRPGGVPAQDHGEGRLPGEQPAAGGGVDGVDPGGPDADQHLPRTRPRVGQLRHPHDLRPTEPVDDDRAHPSPTPADPILRDILPHPAAAAARPAGRTGALGPGASP